MAEEKICESCGMPMHSPEDFGGGKPGNLHCKYCTDEQGNLKDFDTRLEDLTRFVISRSGVDRTVAVQMARENMAKMPAWKGYFEQNGQ